MLPPMDSNDLKALGPLKSKAERQATETARLDAELNAHALAQHQPAPSDLQQRRRLQTQHLNAENELKRLEQYRGPGIDKNLPSRIASIQARAAEADRRAAERDRQAAAEALGR